MSSMLNNLESIPSNDEFLWADFLEIRAMVHPDKAFSRGDLDSVMRAQPEEFNREQSSAKWRFGTDFIRQRINIFGDSYPFSLSEDGDTLTLEQYDDLENIKKLYLSLLICANIKYIPQGTRPTITRSFEMISLPIFTSLMPRGYHVYPNWAGGGANARYTGLLIDKYQAIARDIRCETTTFKPRDFKPRDSGDGGIDIVAWHPFGDDRDAIPAAFVQCGCSKDEWRHKQLEPSYAKLGSKMPVTHPWASYYFLPQDLRWMDGDWAYKADIGGAILIDRLRLINLARENELIDALPPTPYVDDAVSMSYR